MGLGLRKRSMISNSLPGFRRSSVLRPPVVSVVCLCALRLVQVRTDNCVYRIAHHMHKPIGPPDGGRLGAMSSMVRYEARTCQV